jgi:hypothetical protein
MIVRRVACNAALVVLGAIALVASAAYATTTFDVRVVALSGDPVPGVPGAAFQFFGSHPAAPDNPPHIDAAGHVGFSAGWTSAGEPNGVFRESAGRIAGFPAGTTYATFTFTRTNGNGDVAFVGTAVPEGGDVFDEEGAVWRDRGNGVELVLREGMQVPDQPAGTVFDSGFPLFHLDDGRVLLSAEISGMTGPQSGIFLVGADGTIETVLRTGASIDIRGRPRTVSKITAGFDVSDAAGFPLDLEFTDGTTGVVVLRPGGTTAAPGPAALAPASLLESAPNPFRAWTEIRYALARGGRARLELHDVSGRLVTVLLDGSATAGSHAVTWDGRDSHGREAAPGVYFARLSAGGGTITAKVLRVR